MAIFDDGLQDKKIKYDLKIVCFNAVSFAGNQLRLPAGPLREKLTNLEKAYQELLQNWWTKLPKGSPNRGHVELYENEDQIKITWKC